MGEKEDEALMMTPLKPISKPTWFVIAVRTFDEWLPFLVRDSKEQAEIAAKEFTMPTRIIPVIPVSIKDMEL